MSEAATETEPQETQGKPEGTSRYFSQEQVNELIENARKQEKDKLYPTISKADERSQAMQEELKELRKFQKQQEKAEAERLKAIEDAQKAKEEAEMSAKEFAEKVRQENEQRVLELQQQQEQERALLKKELEFMQLQNYTQRRIAEEQDNIAPELLDFVTGNSQEEIEASIERVKAKTEAIVANMKQAGIRQRATMPGVAPAAGTNGVTPLDQQGERQLSAEDIAGMDMSQFAELRQKIGMNGLGSGRGIFG